MVVNCTYLTVAVSFDSTKTDVTMANYTNGYLTYKKNTNQKDTSYLSFYLELSKLESISRII